MRESMADQNSATKSSDKEPRKPYTKPKLRTYGNIQEITQGAPGGTLHDGNTMIGSRTGGV